MRSNFKTTFHLCESTCLACPKCHQDINRCRCFKTVVCSFCCLFQNKNIKQIHKTRNLLLLSNFCILVAPKLCWAVKSACPKNKGDCTRPVKFFFSFKKIQDNSQINDPFTTPCLCLTFFLDSRSCDVRPNKYFTNFSKPHYRPLDVCFSSSWW